MNHIGEGLPIIVIGIAVIIFRRRLLQDTARVQKDIFRFQYGKREIKIAQLVIFIVGVFAITFGILVSLGVVHIKG